MTKPWHELGFEYYTAMKSQVSESLYHDLHFSIKYRTVFLGGSFPILDAAHAVDRYLIELEFPWSYPEDIPLVREIGGRIPWIGDRHIFNNGVACLFVPDERTWIWPIGASFLDFLNGPVRSFFLGQSLFEIEGQWPFGQRSHNVRGILEFYYEQLGTQNAETIDKYLYALSRKELKGHWRCPCGSNKRLRDCHLEQVKSLRNKIPAKVAHKSWVAVHTQVQIQRRKH